MSQHGKSHWIKVYVEMLDDPKVGLLPDSVKWRWVSVLLLAGEMNEDGFLPDVNDMAWRLHTNVETLQGEMRTLAGRGLVELREHEAGDERWFIKAFAKRQAAANSTERSRMSRHRSRQQTGNDDETTMQRNVANSLHKQKQKQNTETETDGESRAAGTQPPPKSRAPKPQPSMITDAHPAVRAIYQVTTFWPAEAAHPVIIEKVGDVPDIKALERMYQLWVSRGYNPKNFNDMLDWYKELSRDPGWMPPTPHKNGKTPPKDTGIVPMKEVRPGVY